MLPPKFGNYIVQQQLGRGGMAVVYLARHAVLDRDVAIKVIYPNLAADPGFEARFRREAQLVASLRHPHIVQLYDFDLKDGQPFMVMEYLAGGTLKDQLRQFRARGVQLPLEQVASILDDIASALDYAHARGAIHRDVKPANIMFTSSGEPVLTDFGIAKILSGAAEISMASGIIGTPAYMSPEQAGNEPLDARSDLYSLGVVLYEMLTGRPPFQGDSPTGVMMQHLNATPPPPSRLNPKLPDSLQAIVLKALAKKPDERFATAGEMARAFRTALIESPATAETILPDAPTALEPRPAPTTPSAKLPLAIAQGNAVLPDTSRQSSLVAPDSQGVAAKNAASVTRPGARRSMSRIVGLGALGLVLLALIGIAAWALATPSPHLAIVAPTQATAPTQAAPPTPSAPPVASVSAAPAQAPSPTVLAVGPAPTTLNRGFFQIGGSLNRDKTAAATDPALVIGTLQANTTTGGWVAWAEKQGNSQQIFASRLVGSQFEPVAASLNIHVNVVAEHPSIDFAGENHTVPWVAWDEPSPGFGNVKQIFVSRFNAASGLWIPAGRDRGDNEPSLNIHTTAQAEGPFIVGGSANPANPPVPWVCWQEHSARNNAVEIFVSRAVSDTTALGGFHWQPVGLNRGGTATDPEPSLNVDVANGQSSSCGITFAGADNTVPWVTWAEKSGDKASQTFVAKAITDTTPGAGGFKWQTVPNCSASSLVKCSLNVNPLNDGTKPFITAGTVTPGQPTVPWIVWPEVGPTGKTQIFVDRLDPVSKNAFLNVGGSLNVDQSHNANAASITFIADVPYVAWQEEVGDTMRVFVRHLASDPQTGTWVLDTPSDGLALDKSKSATRPLVRGIDEGSLLLVWLEGDPAKEASQLVACTNANLTSFLPRVNGLAAPFAAQGNHC